METPKNKAPVQRYWVTQKLRPPGNGLCIRSCGDVSGSGPKAVLEEEGLPDVGSDAEEMDLREQEDKQLTATCSSGIGKTGLTWKKLQEDKDGHLTGFLPGFVTSLRD